MVSRYTVQIPQVCEAVAAARQKDYPDTSLPRILDDSQRAAQVQLNVQCTCTS